MELGDLRESPAGSGDSEAGEWREEIPGEDADVKGNETNEITLDTCDGEAGREKQRSQEEQLRSPYEEELDPRIQVRGGVPAGGGVCLGGVPFIGRWHHPILISK